MSKPFFVIKTDWASQFSSSLDKLKKKKTKAKKKIKAKKSQPAIKKVKKPVEPTRVSPLCVGDEVWLHFGSTYNKTTITECIRPTKSDGNKEWFYKTALSKHTIQNEQSLIPAKLFSMMATDAVKMKQAGFNEALNNTFDSEALILEVYRSGQKRPWAYYVIPDKTIIWKEQTWNHKLYGENYPVSGTLFVKPAKELTMTFLPISSAPQEILTYLGLNIYNKQWSRDAKD